MFSFLDERWNAINVVKENTYPWSFESLLYHHFEYDTWGPWGCVKNYHQIWRNFLSHEQHKGFWLMATWSNCSSVMASIANCSRPQEEPPIIPSSSPWLKAEAPKKNHQWSQENSTFLVYDPWKKKRKAHEIPVSFMQSHKIPWKFHEYPSISIKTISLCIHCLLESTAKYP